MTRSMNKAIAKLFFIVFVLTGLVQMIISAFSIVLGIGYEGSTQSPPAIVWIGEAMLAPMEVIYQAIFSWTDHPLVLLGLFVVNVAFYAAIITAAIVFIRKYRTQV